MAATHPDFKEIQQRLRRLNPAWYPEPLAFDTEYGPGMAKGLDAALGMLEQAHGLTPWAPPVAAPVAVSAPVGSSKVPAQFRFLLEPPVAPLMVRIGLDMIGTLETKGTANNPTIVAWADEVAEADKTPYARWAADWYNSDAVAWCGLFMAVCAVRSAQGNAARMPPEKYLSALEWAKFGSSVPLSDAAVGDVMVLGRTGGGHVTMNVGMESGHTRFYGLGGNQSDQVNILPFDMARVVAVRRPAYSSMPAGARQVTVGAGGASSTNEA